MAISFPLDLITSDGVWRCTRFELLNAQNIGQGGGGVMPVVEIGNYLWAASYETKPLKPTEFDRQKALVHSLRGAMHPFLGWDCTRCKGIYYATGGADAGDYTGELADVASNLHVMTVDQLPANFRVRIGDYCRATMNGNRYYFQIMDDASADGSGSLNTIDVRPHFPANWVAGVTVAFNQPKCLMKIVPGSLQMSRSQNGWGQISFEAIQVLAEPS